MIRSQCSNNSISFPVSSARSPRLSYSLSSFRCALLPFLLHFISALAWSPLQPGCLDRRLRGSRNDVPVGLRLALPSLDGLGGDLARPVSGLTLPDGRCWASGSAGRSRCGLGRRSGGAC